MHITMIPLEEVTKAQITAGDWVVLADDKWPSVQGVRVGN